MRYTYRAERLSDRMGNEPSPLSLCSRTRPYKQGYQDKHTGEAGPPKSWTWCQIDANALNYVFMRELESMPSRAQCYVMSVHARNSGCLLRCCEVRTTMLQPGDYWLLRTRSCIRSASKLQDSASQTVASSLKHISRKGCGEPII